LCGLPGPAARLQPGRLRRIGEAQAQVHPIAGGGDDRGELQGQPLL
jgi:hypothetical protein